jgi:hypothetical protein
VTYHSRQLLDLRIICSWRGVLVIEAEWDARWCTHATSARRGGRSSCDRQVDDRENSRRANPRRRTCVSTALSKPSSPGPRYRTHSDPSATPWHTSWQEQLQLHLDVIVECVNPIALTRDSWSKIAAENGAAILEVEVVCSDESEHRRRVETRTTDVEGLMKPAWAAVMERNTSHGGESTWWRTRRECPPRAPFGSSHRRSALLGTEVSDPAPEDDASGISYTGKGMTDEHPG